MCGREGKKNYMINLVFFSFILYKVIHKTAGPELSNGSVLCAGDLAVKLPGNVMAILNVGLPKSDNEENCI